MIRHLSCIVSVCRRSGEDTQYFSRQVKKPGDKPGLETASEVRKLNGLEGVGGETGSRGSGRIDGHSERLRPFPFLVREVTSDIVGVRRPADFTWLWEVVNRPLGPTDQRFSAELCIVFFSRFYL